MELDAVDVTGLQSWTFTRSLEKGGYLLSFSLRDTNGLETALIPEFLKVYPNLASRARFTLAAGDFNAPPQAPTGIAVLPVANLGDSADADFSITWTDASTNEAGFEIEYADDGVNWQSAGDAIAAASESFAASLPRGTSRSYRVRAVNRFGPSDWATSSAYTAPWLVSFEVNGGDAVAAQEIAPGALASEPFTPVKYGFLFGGWFTDDATFANPRLCRGALSGLPSCQVDKAFPDPPRPGQRVSSVGRRRYDASGQIPLPDGYDFVAGAARNWARPLCRWAVTPCDGDTLLPLDRSDAAPPTPLPLHYGDGLV